MEQVFSKSVISESDAKLALQQIVEIVSKTFTFETIISSDAKAFHTKRSNRQGVSSIIGEIDDDKIILQVELLRFLDEPRISAKSFCYQVSRIGQKVRIAPSKDGHSLTTILEIKANPLSFPRIRELVSEFTNLEIISRALQAELPKVITHDDLTKLYEGLSHLSVVYPWEDVDEIMKDWSRETAELLISSPIAFCAQPIITEFILSSISACMLDYGLSIGRLAIPSVRIPDLLEIVQKAPGKVSVPVTSLSVSTSRYEIFNEMQSVLSAMSASGYSVIFTGTADDLQSTLAGQGSKNDPLLPIVRRVPKIIQLETIVKFAVYQESCLIGGLPKQAEDVIIADICESLEGYNTSEQWRLIPIVVRKAVRLWDNKKVKFTNRVFSEKLRSFRETFAGISTDRYKPERLPEVQDHFLEVLTNPSFLSELQAEIIGQDQATEQLARRLQEEILTRPSYQPLRCLFVGTPASGKSASAELIAKQLGIPYINIDVASMNDLYSGKSSLLGSARGIVGSFEQGILQEAANSHSGALIEVSDLDHAPPIVCAGMSDLFLKVMEAGEVQSATGNIISCANLIIIFTVNLPEGKDEAVMKGFGFSEPNQKGIYTSMISELKKIFSSAFLSRVGSPIIFKPIDASAYAKIVEKAIRSAIFSAAERLKMQIGEIIIEPDVGQKVLATIQTKLTSFGARALLEKGRSMSATAILELHRSGVPIAGHKLVVSMNNEQKFNIKAM